MKRNNNEASLSIKEVTVYVRSLGPYSQGKCLQSQRLPNEAHEDHDERCWRERCHATPDGHIFIPPMAFKQALVGAAQLLNEKIPGKRNQTWTKQFNCGVLIGEGIVLPDLVKDVASERLFVPSDGKKGGGTRVYRRFPLITAWEGELKFFVTSPEITEIVFRRMLDASGLMIGVGRFRVERGGYYGRYEVVKMLWPQ